MALIPKSMKKRVEDIPKPEKDEVPKKPKRPTERYLVTKDKVVRKYDEDKGKFIKIGEIAKKTKKKVKANGRN